MEVDRTQMRRVLARAVGMSEAEVQHIDWPECYWDPERSWADAGRLLEAMRGKPPEVWKRFAVAIEQGLGEDDVWRCPRSLLRYLTPALIAQASYEALEAQCPK